MSDKAIDKISAHISGEANRKSEKQIREKLSASSYRIGPCHVDHITVDLLDDAVTVLKLEIDGPALLGCLGPEYHLTSLEDIDEEVSMVRSNRNETIRPVGDGMIEETHLIIHAADPQQVHYFVSEFCRCIDDKL